jgi:hypothetical protein
VTGQPVDRDALVEIVRLPVVPGGLDDLLAFLDGNPYFTRPELAAVRVLVTGDGTEVLLLLDWAGPGASQVALVSPEGVALVEGLGPLLAGPPVTAHHWEVRR